MNEKELQLELRVKQLEEVIRFYAYAGTAHIWGGDDGKVYERPYSRKGMNPFGYKAREVLDAPKINASGILKLAKAAQILDNAWSKELIDFGSAEIAEYIVTCEQDIIRKVQALTPQEKQILESVVL